VSHAPRVQVSADAVPSVVLLVDDQAMVGEAVRRMLADEPDIAFHFCADPVGALAAAKQIGPTVILQDLVMPGVSGFSLLGQYRADVQTADIPVMVLSTKEDPVVKSDAFAAGASDYLVKLPDRIELIARIRLHSRARVNQLQRDEAHRALRESQQQLIASHAELLSLHRQLEQASEALRFEATHDSLSGLMNRRAFFDNLQREAARMARRHEPLALIMADIDHFKAINDSHGHVAGDAVIREVSRRLQSSVRASDVVGRYGGEEFIVLPNDCRVDDVVELAERIRSACAAPVTIADRTIPISVSLGVAVSAGHPEVEKLLHVADEALYRAKRGGRNRVELHAG
jgi:two-component system, chemotaxis family, response regulator WspR